MPFFGGHASKEEHQKEGCPQEGYFSGNAISRGVVMVSHVLLWPIVIAVAMGRTGILNKP